MSSEDKNNLWREIATAQRGRQPIVAATVVRSTGSVPRRTGAKMLVLPDGSIRGSVGGGLFESLVVKDALEALGRRASLTKTYSFNPKGSGPQAFGAVCGGRAEIFLEVIVPSDRLLIVGGGHCGQALARMASQMDFSIVVADDRAQFALPELFAYDAVESVLNLPADYEGLPEADADTYVALVSKGYITDEAALRRVLTSPAPYIGMIGSCRKRDIVFDNLRADGVPESQLARVHAPIGIEIGAETPEEIAVSILAEIIAVRAKRRRAVQAAPEVEAGGGAQTARVAELAGAADTSDPSDRSDSSDQTAEQARAAGDENRTVAAPPAATPARE
jgi:xanthine dehydrogenase accessory factor